MWTPHKTAWRRALYCSRPCRDWWRKRDYHRQVVRPYLDSICPIPWRTCADCGEVFIAKHLRRRPHRCRPCAAKAQQVTDARKNLKRRRARLGMDPAAGHRPMSVFQLAERDGAMCHICRRPIDMRLPGTDPAGPTRDHLIPVAAGGTDDPVNLALAHRQCNCIRRDGAAQLRLTA